MIPVNNLGTEVTTIDVNQAIFVSFTSDVVEEVIFIVIVDLNLR
jgi:hypothetical protein